MIFGTLPVPIYFVLDLGRYGVWYEIYNFDSKPSLFDNFHMESSNMDFTFVANNIYFFCLSHELSIVQSLNTTR